MHPQRNHKGVTSPPLCTTVCISGFSTGAGGFYGVNGPAARSGNNRPAEGHAAFRPHPFLSRPGQACPRHARGDLGDGGWRGRPAVLRDLNGQHRSVVAGHRGGLYPTQDGRSAGARPEHAAADAFRPSHDLRPASACRRRSVLAQGVGAVRGCSGRGLRPGQGCADDLRRGHGDARPNGRRDQGIQSAEPAARPRDDGQGDRPARPVQRGERRGRAQRGCADRQACRRLRLGAPGVDPQHGWLRCRRSGADPAGRPRLDGASASMARGKRGA